MKEFNYDLISELLIVKNGGKKEIALSICVKEPKNILLTQIGILEQELRKSEMGNIENLRKAIGEDKMEAMMGLADSKNRVQEAQEILPAEITDKKESRSQGLITTLFSGGADLNKVFEAFKKILNVSASVDGVPMTPAIFDDMTPLDTKNILGEYYINFTQASQLN